MMDKLKLIEQLIDESETSIISSVDEDGFPTTRAMLAVRHREGLKTIYFSTNTSTNKINHFRKNRKACLYFFDKNRFLGAMLKGYMEILQDPASKELLWRDGDTLYYPEGVSDPDYSVLKFTAISIRHYNGSCSEDIELQ